jgi:hypothetical protein
MSAWPPRDFVRQHQVNHPPVLYLREDAIAGPIDRFLHEELGHRNLAANLRKLAAAHQRSVTDDEAEGADNVVRPGRARFERGDAALPLSTLQGASDRCRSLREDASPCCFDWPTSA